MTTKKTLPLVATGLLLATALLALVVPVADAHSCTATHPETSCGSCSDGQNHDHRYTDGRMYCQSTGPRHYICIWWGAVSGIELPFSIVTSDLPGRDATSTDPRVIDYRCPPYCIPVPIGP